MEFPIPREKLQNIQSSVEEYVLQTNINKCIDDIKFRIIAHAYAPIPTHRGGMSNTQLKIDISHYHFAIPKEFVSSIISSSHPLTKATNPMKTHILVIKEKLIELFPGVRFETDPLMTYMLIDWS